MGMSGGVQTSQGMVPQQQANTASNLLQSLNRPGPGMNIQNMQNKMQGIGMMPGQQGGPINHMGQMQNMQGGGMINQMNQIPQQQINQMGQMLPGQMQQNIPNQMQNQVVQGQMQGQLQNQMQGQLNSGMQNVQQNTMNQMGQVQIVQDQLPQQMQHIQRKPVEIMNSGFPGPRNVTPNQFLRQSPSPSAPSPASLGGGGPTSNQMVPSPALVPSPSPQHPMMAGQQRSIGMAPSPSSSLNTPGPIGATPSPHEDQVYRDKVRQLSKYIEPIRNMITKTGLEGNLDKLSKMKNLLVILQNPTKRVPLETILKCERVLEKQLDLKRSDNSVGTINTSMKEQHFFTPLIDAVSSHLQSPVTNHTLQRTFGPCLEALFGPEIK